MTRAPSFLLVAAAALALLPARSLPLVGPGVAPPPGRQASGSRDPRDLEALPFSPRHYVCYRAPVRPAIDGRLDEAAWRAAPWTDPFLDIEGGRRPAPRFRTRARMLWDDQCLYVAADMEEPDIWATLTERDSVVYQDNDVEVFIDPDGDTHEYYEVEVNALGTVWDLMLVRPYRDGGPPVTAWDIAGLGVGIDVRGTLNRPGDRDQGWTVELAMPWRILREAAPGRRPPRPGERWRINFSRVEWQVEVKDGRYVKRIDPATGKPLAADNWTWTLQGVVDMHMPERWGSVQFSALAAGAGTEPFVADPDEHVKWALRRLYYRQRRFRALNGRYAPDLATLGAAEVAIEGHEFRPVLQATEALYDISARAARGGFVHIRQDGRTWLSR